VQCFTPSLLSFFPSCVLLLLSPSSLAFVPPLFIFYFVCLICWLFVTLCGCHPWGFTQTFPSNFECTVNLLHAHFATHHSLLIFLVSSCNVLSTPPSTSVSGQHTIGFLPIIVILIICFLCFSFGYFFRFCLYLLVFPLLFPCTFSSVCSFYFFVRFFLSCFYL
jgi:hypothetical protein